MRDGPIRVLLTDDHPVVRGGLTALFGTLEGIELVAAVPDGATAIREAVLGRPDVVVLDLQMPGLDGIATMRRLAVEAPDVAVLVLTMFDDDALLVDALEAGAKGYLLKGAEPEEIERAVRAVADGAAIFSPEVAARVLGSVSRPRSPVPLPELTPREREVLDLLARGLPNAVVAQELGIAIKTVGNHVSAIFLKLGVATRPEAIVRAREAGLGT